MEPPQRQITCSYTNISSHYTQQVSACPAFVAQRLEVGCQLASDSLELSRNPCLGCQEAVYKKGPSEISSTKPQWEVLERSRGLCWALQERPEAILVFPPPYRFSALHPQNLALAGKTRADWKGAQSHSPSGIRKQNLEPRGVRLIMAAEAQKPLQRHL